MIGAYSLCDDGKHAKTIWFLLLKRHWPVDDLVSRQIHVHSSKNQLMINKLWMFHSAQVCWQNEEQVSPERTHNNAKIYVHSSSNSILLKSSPILQRLVCLADSIHLSNWYQSNWSFMSNWVYDLENKPRNSSIWLLHALKMCVFWMEKCQLKTVNSDLKLS